MEEYWIFIIIAVIFVGIGAGLIFQGIKIGQGLIPFEPPPDKNQDQIKQSQFIAETEDEEPEQEYEKNINDQSLDS